jgi:exonuclease SbcD
LKILHTADIHLRQDDSETVEALEQVLAEAKANNVDLLTIGGDLFDSPEDAESLRPQLRDLLKDNPFDILAIPGNHDEDVYRENLRFGNDLQVLTETPYAGVEFDDVEVVGVPFTSSMSEDLYSALEKKSGEKTQILLLHCTLDIGFHSGAVGEDEGKYFPVTKATLAELDYDYVLAGHIHSKLREVPLENGGTFLYPGSPVSHSTKEEGKRKAVLIDTETESISSISLNTFYYDSISRLVRPGEEVEVLEEIEEWVALREDDNCELEVEVDGFVGQDEDEFYEDLQDAANPVDPEDNTRSATPVLEHPLYQRFSERLEEKDADEEMVETRVIEVLSQLIAQNKVQSS